MAQTKPKAGQFYGVSNNGTDGQFLQTDGTGGMAWAATITDPTITSIDYPGSATAADPAGGESVIINGTLFASGITCTVGGTSAVTAFNSATQITITTPAKAAGPYTVAVLNPDGGTASQASFIQYSGVPVWSTAAGTLGNVIEGGAASFQVTATEGSDTIEYSVTTGTLPTGLSLATATGAITGTAGSVSADTTTTFSITATDDENQTSASRSFSITVQNDAPSNHFNTVIYTGTGTSGGDIQNVTGVGFSPGLTWVKNRSFALNHYLYDSIRGTGTAKALHSNTTSSEASGSNYSDNGGVSSFSSDGFGAYRGSDNTYQGTNMNGQNYVSWNFKAGGAAVANTDGTINSQVSVNNSLGFSIVSYTGNQTNNATVGHGLSSAPDLWIGKNIDQTGPWQVLCSSFAEGGFLALDSNAAKGTSSNVSFDPTSTTVKFQGGQNINNGSCIAYAFTSKTGFSKVGSYTGTGVSGNSVVTGFQPAFVMIKKTNGADLWIIQDDKRSPTNPSQAALFANLSDAEYATYGTFINFLANGFEIANTDGVMNGSGGNYIYLAFAADGSTATPSLANSFATTLNNSPSNNQAVAAGFTPDAVWIKGYSGSSSHAMAWGQYDTIRGGGFNLDSATSDAQGNYNTHPNGDLGMAFTATGYTTPPLVNNNVNNSVDNYVNYFWKAGGTPSINTDGTITSVVSANQAAGFSIVSYTGSSTLGDTIGHGLGTPELIICKKTTGAANWAVWSSTFSAASETLFLDLTSPSNQYINRFGTVTSTTFQAGSSGGSEVNPSGAGMIAYCFTSISGFSKVGSYTGNQSLNTANQINFGFTPSFVLIKNTTNSGSQWMIFDSARTNGYVLYANSNSTESNYSTDLLLSSQGLEFKSTNINVNQSGATYIYLAIKEN